MIRLAIRGYSGKSLIFEERIEVELHEPDAIAEIAERQMKRMLGYPRHMIEIEFLDEGDVNQRFFRFGTDPRGMISPHRIDLKKTPGV